MKSINMLALAALALANTVAAAQAGVLGTDDQKRLEALALRVYADKSVQSEIMRTEAYYRRARPAALPDGRKSINSAAEALGMASVDYALAEDPGMTGEVVVMEAPDYAAWLAAQTPASSLAQEGGTLFRELGCSGCHEGSSKIHAPSLDGLYGRPVPLSDGSTVIADDKYIRDSILLPRSQIAAGYEPLMPSFEGKVNEDQLLRLVLYIKSLGGRHP